MASSVNRPDVTTNPEPSGSPSELLHGDNELLHQFLSSSGVTEMPSAGEKRANTD